MAGPGCVATYIWPGAQGASDIRTLRRVLQSVPTSVEEVPVACFDGNQTGQASIRYSSITLKPVKLFDNPVGGLKDVLVLCQTMDPLAPADKGLYLSPHPTNNRAPCERVMSEAAASEPTFVVVQEYSIWDGLTDRPLGANLGIYITFITVGFVVATVGL
jgi:glutamine synthetase